MRSVIHHYEIPLRVSLEERVPFGAVVLSAAMRPSRGELDRPTIYVQKPVGRSDNDMLLKAFFVGTGQEFDRENLFPFSFVATLRDGPYFWHVFAGICPVEVS